MKSFSERNEWTELSLPPSLPPGTVHQRVCVTSDYRAAAAAAPPGAQQLYVTHFSHKHRSHVYDPFVAFISRAGMKLIIWSFFRLTEQL